MEPDTTHDRSARVIKLDEGLELRPFRIGDAAVLNEIVKRNRDRLRQWLPWLESSYSLEDTRRFLADCERQHAFREALSMSIWNSGKMSGAIGFHRFDLRHRNSSIGYWIDGASEGRGIMTRACRAMVTEGFHRYGLHRIEIRCATGNNRSASIPRRLGFAEEGVLRDAEWLYDHWVDLHVFSMLEHDWEKA
jgi:ribosomal-protein-serine acetyltransferase